MGSIFSGDGWEGVKWPFLVMFILLNIVWYLGEYIM